MFNIDGRDVYYDDLEAVYDDEAAANTEDDSADDMGELDL